MLGIVVILAVSWGLLRFFEGKNLLVLGFLPLMPKLLQFVLGFVMMSLIYFVFFALDTWLYDMQWARNTDTSLETFARSFWYYLRSVVTEDLVFRGALLYLLMVRFGAKLGMVLSAVAFGIYHWFSFGMFNESIQIIPLLYVFVATGFLGFAWAYSFYKTASIMMPMGLHMGWNHSQSLVFPNNPYGELLFRQVSQGGLSEWGHLIYLFGKALLIPLIILVVLHLFYKNHTQ